MGGIWTMFIKLEHSDFISLVSLISRFHKNFLISHQFLWYYKRDILISFYIWEYFPLDLWRRAFLNTAFIDGSLFSFQITKLHVTIFWHVCSFWEIYNQAMGRRICVCCFFVPCFKDLLIFQIWEHLRAILESVHFNSV